MSIAIRRCYDGKVIYTAEDASVLSNADLSEADLRGAVLSGAVLRDADLRNADLRGWQRDLWDVLDHAPAEFAGLRAKLIAGEVDGSCYEGACACLVGTLANLRDCDYRGVEGIVPDAGRPAEEWFMPIRPGDRPETPEPMSEGSFRARLAGGWIDEWRESRTAIAAALGA